MKKKWWTEDKISWYERSAIYSSFHTDLASIIEQHLIKNESVLEFGCGLGHIASLLASTHPILAIDIDEEVIKRAKEREKKDIYFNFDYKKFKEKKDALLCIFFGRIKEEDNLSFLMDRTKRHLIYIYSEHKGQRDDLISRKSPTKEEMEEYINEKGYPFSSSSYTLSFPQYLKSKEEAEIFIKATYPKNKTKEYMEYVKESGIEEYPFILENKKKIILFDIYKV